MALAKMRHAIYLELMDWPTARKATRRDMAELSYYRNIPYLPRHTLVQGQKIA